MRRSVLSGKKTRTRKSYSAEFKGEAVRLALSGTRSKGEVARNIGISSAMLSNWCRAASVRASAGNQELNAEVKRLESEVRQLKLERDILKKAAAYFIKNQ
jgi:transposase